MGIYFGIAECKKCGGEVGTTFISANTPMIWSGKCANCGVVSSEDIKNSHASSWEPRTERHGSRNG